MAWVRGLELGDLYCAECKKELLLKGNVVLHSFFPMLNCVVRSASLVACH